LATAKSQLLRLHVADMTKSTMARRLGHLLYWIASSIAVILIAVGIVVWLYFARPNYDPLGLVIVAWGIIVWLGGRAIRYWLAGR
jgi:membrane protein YdbS with pleckstrin-like domain